MELIQEKIRDCLIGIAQQIYRDRRPREKELPPEIQEKLWKLSELPTSRSISVLRILGGEFACFYLGSEATAIVILDREMNKLCHTTFGIKEVG